MLHRGNINKGRTVGKLLIQHCYHDNIQSIDRLFQEKHDRDATLNGTDQSNLGGLLFFTYHEMTSCPLHQSNVPKKH